MKLLETIKFSLKALDYQDELSSSFLHGKKMKLIPHLQNVHARYPGQINRVLSFIKFLVTSASIGSTSRVGTSVLFFSGTHNQYISLEGTITAFREKGHEFSVLGFKSKSSHALVTHHLKFPLEIIFVALVLTILRYKKLIKALRADDNSIGIEKYLDNFLRVYAFYPYFFNLLKNSDVRYVVQSNDHNAPNRILNVVSKLLNIKTIYMQHASVSNVFPPLVNDYAFLDGLAAAQVYRECDVEKTSSTTVFLTGQKKNIEVLVREPRYIGIAVNSLDSFDKLISFIERFESGQVKFRIRFHPAQKSDFVKCLYDLSGSRNNISVSDPLVEPLSIFFLHAYLIVSGNSSIHLESTLSRTPTFYYTFGDDSLFDYYSYIKNGLISEFYEELFSLEDFKDVTAFLPPKLKEATQFYSETFETEWEGREGELVYQTFLLINDSRKFDSIYKRLDKNENEPNEIWQLIK